MIKKSTCSILIICLILLFAACSTGKNDDSVIFIATVLENESSLLVEPQQDSNEIRSSDKIVVHTTNTKIYNANGEGISLSDINAGQTLQITYNGMIAESYPAQISADKISVIE